MFSNRLDQEQRSEKADADEKLQLPEESPNFPGTNGNPKQEPDLNTHLPDDFEHTPDSSLPPSSGNGDFPEGGARAWSVVAGAAGITFCSLGYCNAFGYGLYF
jgi:hypothetical protein